MKNKMVTLQLEPYDDHVSVRDRLSFVHADHVLLILPQVPILRRKLDLLLIQREAARLGIRLALVTGDSLVIDHADELSISVFPDEQTAAQSRWKRPRDKVFLPPRAVVDQYAFADVIRDHRSNALGGLWDRRSMRWLLFGLVMLALVVGFLVAAPSATVTLTPASRQVYETVTVLADPALTDIDVERRQIPASLVSLQPTSRVTVQASGSEAAGASLAQGIVLFTNTSEQPALIPLGTIVSTADIYPVRFETVLETTLTAGPGASVQVPVRALPEHAGAVGNVDPGAISRVEAAFADHVTVTNPNATYGGAVQHRATVTAQDLERLLVLGRQQVLQNARDTLLHQLSSGQFLVPGSILIVEERPDWTIYSALVGDPVESVSLDFRARVQAVVVDERLAQRVAYAALAPYIQPGQEIAQDALRFSRGETLSVEANGRVSFAMVVSGSIAVSIDPDQVRRSIAGLSINAARARLDRELLLDPQRPPQIQVWPGLLGRMPFLPVRIAVRVQSP